MIFSIQNHTIEFIAKNGGMFFFFENDIHLSHNSILRITSPIFFGSFDEWRFQLHESQHYTAACNYVVYSTCRRNRNAISLCDRLFEKNIFMHWSIFIESYMVKVSKKDFFRLLTRCENNELLCRHLFADNYWIVQWGDHEKCRLMWERSEKFI